MFRLLLPLLAVMRLVNANAEQCGRGNYTALASTCVFNTTCNTEGRGAMVFETKTSSFEDCMDICNEGGYYHNVTCDACNFSYVDYHCHLLQNVTGTKKKTDFSYGVRRADCGPEVAPF